MRRKGIGCMNPPQLASMQPGLLVPELTLSGVGFVIGEQKKAQFDG